MLKVYVIGNQSVLGTITKRTITGIKVDSAEVVGETQFVEYIKIKNIGGLISVNVGKGKDLVSVELTAAQGIQYETVVSKFERAAEQAQGFLVNLVYDGVFQGK